MIDEVIIRHVISSFLPRSGVPGALGRMALSFLGLAAAASVSARGGTIRVPADHQTIQTAIGAARPGDTVLVAEGTYVFREPITFAGKNITLRSEGGPLETTLRLFDPKDSSRASVVVFESGEGRGAILEGFTITGGRGTTGLMRPNLGGAILCRGASPTIRYNVMRENELSNGGHGGGIACIGGLGKANPMIVHNLICYNATDRGGGGVYFGQASGIFLENTVLGNTSGDDGGGICCELSDPLIQGNTIVGNVARTFGGGFSNFGPPAPGIVIVNNTIAGNAAGDVGGGVFIMDPPVSVRNCIIRGNLQAFGLEVAQMEPDRMPEVFYCCLAPGSPCSSNGNTCLDPGFPDPGSWDPCEENPGAPCVQIRWHLGDKFACWRNGDYELPLGSPCIDAGDPQDPLDPDGTRADIGAIYFDIERAFLRGDVDADRSILIADVLIVLRGIFLDASEIACQDAADVDDNGHIGLADAILVLLHIFHPMPPEIPPPRVYPGPDPTRDRLRCASGAGSAG